MTETNPRKLVALIGCSDEWLCRSLESVFAEKGYDVTRTGSGKQALKLARRGGYDVLMLDEQLYELTGVDVCLALREDPLFDHATPIVIISSSHSTLPGRIKAYAAGAWEYCHLPLDVDGLFLRLVTFLRARQELAASQATSLMDPASGLYTQYGLHQMTEQLEARVSRLLPSRPNPNRGSEDLTGSASSLPTSCMFCGSKQESRTWSRRPASPSSRFSHPIRTPPAPGYWSRACSASSTRLRRTTRAPARFAC